MRHIANGYIWWTIPVLILPRVDHAWYRLVHIGAGADGEEDDKEEGVEVEKGRLSYCISLVVICSQKEDTIVVG
jgi:hypothetical protein